MKKDRSVSALGILVILIVSSFIPSQIVRANSCVDVEEAVQLLFTDEDIIILDVRTPVEYESGRLPGAESIPLSELEERIDELDRDGTIIVYCKSGVRSEEACTILVNHGYKKVYNLLGGINAWSDLELPLISSSKTSKEEQYCPCEANPSDTHDECETDPESCTCDTNTCLYGCAGEITGWCLASVVGYFIGVVPSFVVEWVCAKGIGELVPCFNECVDEICIEKTKICIELPIIGEWCITIEKTCISIGGDPCEHGHVCSPCEEKPTIDRRCYDIDTYEVEICRCDGQGWDNWKRMDCPEGKVCWNGLCREPVHDVAAISQIVSETQVWPGTLVNIEVTVENLGHLTESFDLTCYYDTEEIGTKRVENLAAGISTSVIFTWNTSNVPLNKYFIMAWADSGKNIDEADEENNWCHIQVPVFVIPELPLGTITALVFMLAALILNRKIPIIRK